MNKTIVAASLIAAISGPAFAGEETWEELRSMMFEGKEIHDGKGVLALEAPYRAHNAAVVPISVDSLLSPEDPRWIARLHLIIDENPSPVAGIFELSEEIGDGRLSTRIRVNEYSYVRAIAELSDGGIYMAKAFVKAAGGCSAPATTDPEAALARLGKMKFKQSKPEGGAAQAKLLISHPNYSGLQIDQLTRNWIPPDYISHVEISRDGETLMSVDSDISLSEDPAISFTLNPDRAGTLHVSVEDTEGRSFEQSWTVGSSS